jgi:hypothetical protein
MPFVASPRSASCRTEWLRIGPSCFVRLTFFVLKPQNQDMLPSLCGSVSLCEIPMPLNDAAAIEPTIITRAKSVFAHGDTETRRDSNF